LRHQFRTVLLCLIILGGDDHPTDQLHFVFLDRWEWVGCLVRLEAQIIDLLDELAGLLDGPSDSSS
jgi:hypothetical protein